MSNRSRPWESRSLTPVLLGGLESSTPEVFLEKLRRESETCLVGLQVKRFRKAMRFSDFDPMAPRPTLRKLDHDGAANLLSCLRGGSRHDREGHALYQQLLLKLGEKAVFGHLFNSLL